MQVDASAPVEPGASRRTAQAWSPPLLIDGLLSTTTLNESLWSNSDERRAERLEGLKDDQQRVDDVLEGLGPTDVQQAAQVRMARDDVRDAGTARAVRRELNQQTRAKSEPAFRSVLDHARSGPSRPPTPTGASTTSTEAAPSSSPMSGTADSSGSGASETSEAGQTVLRPPGGTPASGTAVSEAGRPGALPAAPTNVAAATTGAAATSVPGAGGAFSATAATSSPAVQRVEPTGAPTSSAPSSTSPSTQAGTPAAPREKDHPTSSAREPSVADGEAEQAKSDGDTRAENVERVLRVLRGSLHRERSTTVIRMDPPELGALRLELDLRKDVLKLRMSAEHVAAQELLRDGLDALRRGLEMAGIRLERIEIQPLVAPQEPPPPGTFGDFGRKRGDGEGESGPSASRRPTSARSSLGVAETGIESVLPGAVALGSARLNLMA